MITQVKPVVFGLLRIGVEIVVFLPFLGYRAVQRYQTYRNAHENILLFDRILSEEYPTFFQFSRGNAFENAFIRNKIWATIGIMAHTLKPKTDAERAKTAMRCQDFTWEEFRAMLADIMQIDVDSKTDPFLLNVTNEFEAWLTKEIFFECTEIRISVTPRITTGETRLHIECWAPARSTHEARRGNH